MPGTGLAANPVPGTRLAANPMSDTGLAANLVPGTGLAANPVPGTRLAANPMSDTGLAANLVPGTGLAANPVPGTRLAANPVPGTGICSLTHVKQLQSFLLVCVLGLYVYAMCITEYKGKTDVLTLVYICLIAIIHVCGVSMYIPYSSEML